MYGKTDAPQQWSVHAEFTISHPGAGDPENLPQTNTVQDENGVRMFYSWTANEDNNQWSTVSEASAPSASLSNRSVCSEMGRPFGYQRGNMHFTSTPPRKFFENASRLGVPDSGYGSDLLSPKSLPANSSIPHNRKCRSTCSIVLTTSPCDRPPDGTVQCGRTQSLRCQTPASRCDNKNSNFYGCGDPWCHHSHFNDDLAYTGRISPVLESSEDARKEIPPTGRFSLPSYDYVNPTTIEKKDASVQTLDMIDKCTSPIMARNFNKAPTPYVRGSERAKRGKPVNTRPFDVPPVPSPAQSLDRSQLSKKLTRLANLKTAPLSEQHESKKSASESSDPTKKPRTIHIDVYCTGTDMESDESSSSDSSLPESASTPQTVFESGKVCVTHKRAENSKLPFNLRDKLNELSLEKEDSDVDDDASTAYPSKMSSYSTINDFSSSISSVPKSWMSFSTSSYTIPDDYDSVAGTSWKDTFSDIDSLIAENKSLDCVPKSLLEKSLSIDETPEFEYKDVPEIGSKASLQSSESFDYANSEDRLRIKKMEDMWRNKSDIRRWRPPQSEKRLLVQQRKMQEYIKKRLTEQSKSKESDSDLSDDSERGWTFIKNNDKMPEVVSKTDIKPKPVLQEKEHTKLKTVDTSHKPKDNVSEGKLADATAPSLTSSHLDPLEQIYDPTLSSPFTLFPGKYTEQRLIANRFGPVVSVLRKPGHHIGPAKNPECLCDHCQRYFESIGYNRQIGIAGAEVEPAVVLQSDFTFPAQSHPIKGDSKK